MSSNLTCLKSHVEGNLKPLHKAIHAIVSNLVPPAINQQIISDLRSALASMRADDRDLWIRNGHRLKTLGEVGRGLFIEWSQTSVKYDPQDADRVWKSFKPDHTGYKAIFAEAKERGWLNPRQGLVPNSSKVLGSQPIPDGIQSKDEKLFPNTKGLLTAFRHPHIFGIYVGFDSFQDKVMYHFGDEQWIELTDEGYIMLREKFIDAGFKEINAKLFREALHAIAKENMFDSAQVWISGLTWDGVSRVGNFFSDYINCGHGDYQTACANYLWTALAGRIMKPGCKADMTPILSGVQGIKKSSAVQAISPNTDYFCDIDLNERDDNLSRLMRGKLVGELNELRGLNTKDSEGIKSFLTRQQEEWTPKFKEFSGKYSRRIIFIGTTNEDQFLADPTGNRRFLPLKVQDIDIDAIKRDKLQLWAEGLILFQQHGIMWQEAESLAKQRHAEHEITDPWEEPVREWLGLVPKKHPSTGAYTTPQKNPNGFTVSELLDEALFIDKKFQTKAHSNRASAILRKLGYIRRQERINSDKKDRDYFWYKDKPIGKWNRVSKLLRRTPRNN